MSLIQNIRLVWGLRLREACQIDSGQIMKGFILFVKAIRLYFVVSRGQWGAPEDVKQICVLKRLLFRMYYGDWEEGDGATGIGWFSVF